MIRLFDKYVQKVLDFKKANCVEMVATAELNGVESLCVLLGALLTETNGVCVLILKVALNTPIPNFLIFREKIQSLLIPSLLNNLSDFSGVTISSRIN